jgi:aspartate/methionine/tyrosine aminotransferase
MFGLSRRVQKIAGSERSLRKIVIPEGTIRMNSGDPDFPTPEHIQQAAFKAMQDNHTHLRERIRG